MDRKMILASAVILLAFSIGLVGFFLVSADLGDGLEVTMEEAGVEEQEQVWKAPFDYGDNYVAALIAGIIGFVASFGLVYVYMKGAKRMKQEN